MQHVTMKVSLGAIAGNFDAIRSSANGLGVIVVLKANAYGFGVDKVARLLKAHGCAGIAVASVDEAAAVRKAVGARMPVLVLGTLLPDETEDAVRLGLRMPIASLAEAKRVSAAAVAAGRKVKCHIALDTGMSRVGFRPDDAVAEVPKIAKLPALEIEGMYTHFPTADVVTNTKSTDQVAVFKKTLAALAAKGVRPTVLHIANSDGFNNVPGVTDAPFTHVRLGLALYGPFGPVTAKRPVSKPAVEIVSKVAQVRTVKAGLTIGYGRTFKCERDMRVATIAAGYADGVPLALSNKGTVLVRGVPCPVVGRVCMDFMMVDVSAVKRVADGDEAVLVGRRGRHEVTICDWAAAKGTHPHDILCAISSRAVREYVD